MLRRTPRDIILVTLRMVPVQRRFSRRGDHIPIQILNLVMMQNGKSHCKSRQQQGSQGIPSSLLSSERVCVSEWAYQVVHLVMGDRHCGHRPLRIFLCIHIFAFHFFAAMMHLPWLGTSQVPPTPISLT